MCAPVSSYSNFFHPCTFYKAAEPGCDSCIITDNLEKKINSVFPALAAGKSERLIVSVWTFLITISSLYFCLCEHTLPNRWWAAYPAAGDGGWVVGYCGASLVVSLIFHYIDITVVLFRCCQNSQLISTLAYYTSSLPDRQQNQHRAATGRWKLLFHYIR